MDTAIRINTRLFPRYHNEETPLSCLHITKKQEMKVVYATYNFYHVEYPEFLPGSQKIQFIDYSGFKLPLNVYVGIRLVVPSHYPMFLTSDSNVYNKHMVELRMPPLPIAVEKDLIEYMSQPSLLKFTSQPFDMFFVLKGYMISLEKIIDKYRANLHNDPCECFSPIPPSVTMTTKAMFVAVLVSILAITGTSGHCPISCTCDDDTLVVNCVKGNLDVVPITLNPSIQRLNLRENSIKTATSFVFYGGLLYLDLSHNELVNIPVKCFETQSKLDELHLNNNKISSLTNMTFFGLKSLKILNLRHNFLLDLPDRFFRFLTQLEELDLGQNRISRIDPSAFEGLTSLRVLYLHDNQLKSVPTHSFSFLGSLAVLHVGLNAFTTLPDESFSVLQRLSVLDLTGAGLVNISENAFKGIIALRNLALTDNQLSAIPTRVLSKFNRLEELSLGQNSFSSIPAGCLDGLVHLQRLDITGAQELVRIEKGAFANNLNLRTLIFNSNKKLSEIQDGALTGLPNLKELSLRANAFRSLSENMVAWPELTKLDVSENPLVCDCSVLWLRDLLLRRNVSYVRCTGPNRVEDRFLHSLTPDELGCALRSARQQAVIAVICATIVFLIVILSILLYRYRRRLQDLLKEYKWNKRAMSRKEHEYQKTFSDEDYIVRTAAAQHHHQQTLKPIPVTEL